MNLTRGDEELIAWISELHQPSISDLSDSLEISKGAIRARINNVRVRTDDKDSIIHSDAIYRVSTEYVESVDVQEYVSDDTQELNQREEFILSELPATASELASTLQIEQLVVEAHLDSIEQKGYTVDYDDRTGTYYSNSSTVIRSSKNTGSITRGANEWWQKRHDKLERDFRAIQTPDVDLSYTKGNQDVVSHLTDIHMGDLIHDDSGKEIYNAEIVKRVIQYITQKQIRLYNLQSEIVDIDTWHELWGGDFLTNEGIYQNQYEDLEIFLDEQHGQIIEPLLERVKAISDVADTVNIVCKVGNHGRADGKSKQANADLILYRTLEKQVSTLQKHADLLNNVNIEVGSTAPYKNFTMRGGNIRGHLRHGQYRKAGFRTSASQNEWRETLLHHEFDIGYMGHVHRGQRFHVDGSPVFVSGSAKPAGEFAEQIAAGVDYNIALFHGVSDDGLTFSYPIDFRDFEITE